MRWKLSERGEGEGSGLLRAPWKPARSPTFDRLSSPFSHPLPSYLPSFPGARRAIEANAQGVGALLVAAGSDPTARRASGRCAADGLAKLKPHEQEAWRAIFAGGGGKRE